MSETVALITGLRTAFDMAKALKGIHDAVERDKQISGILETLLSTQLQAMAMSDSNSALKSKIVELEAEIARLKDWSAEKQNYTCRLIAKGVFAYVLNETKDNFEQAEKFCCRCFDDGKKSLLQHVSEFLKGIDLSCPNCRFSVLIHEYLGAPKKPNPVPFV